jgi:hypothetical protein
MEIPEHRLASASRPAAQVQAADSPGWEHRSVTFSEPEVAFPKLNLRRDRATRVVVFDVAPMREQLSRSGLTMEAIYELSQEGLRDLLLAWYIECISRGGQCSAEITAAVREMRAANPIYSVVIRPVCNSPEGVSPAQALMHRPEDVPQAPERKRRVGLFETIRANFIDFLCEDGDIEAEKPYVVPSGPALHLRPVRFRRDGLKEA